MFILESIWFLEEVKNIPELLKSIKIGNTNSFGTGGIRTKIQAAEKVTASGIPMILANSKNEKPLASLMDGSKKGTIFLTDDDDKVFHAATRN